MSETKTPVDLQLEVDREITTRIAKAWREIRRGVSNGALRELIFESDEYSIEPGQLDTLEQVIYHDNIRMGDLADAMRIDPSTATRAIQRLIKDGLAEKVSHDGDGRVVVIGPTQKGRDLYNHVVERRRAVVLGIVNQFDEKERALVAETLERFVSALDSAVAQLSSKKR